MNIINSRAKELKQGAIRAMFDRAAKMENVISMGIGEPDLATPLIVCEAGKNAMDQGMTHYTPNAGELYFRKALVQKTTLKDMNYSPENEIIVTNGGMGALSLLFAITIEEGDEVLIQDPQWLNYFSQVKLFGGVPVPVPTKSADGFVMRPEAIEALITDKTKMIMVNSPNNPTGEVISKEKLEKIAEIAIKHDLYVVSDEVYNTLLYTDEPYISIASLPGMRERTIVINSFSKSYAMTGWRIGYAAGPAAIIDKMVKCQENFNACANAIGQYAANEALNHPELHREIRDVFAKRREILLAGLNKIEGMKTNCPEGAFYIFADISAFGLSSIDFCNRLLEDAGVVCIPGSAFGENGEGFIRIAYTCAENKLLEAIERIDKFCKSL